MAGKESRLGEKCRAWAFTLGVRKLATGIEADGCKDCRSDTWGNLRILRAGSGTGQLNQFMAGVGG